MKKRTAIFLFGGVLCGIASYVAWCFRAFYLPPRLEFNGNPSPEARRAVEKWRWSRGCPRELEFSWKTAWWNLQHPWKTSTGEPLQAVEEPDFGLTTWIGHPHVRISEHLWTFSKTAGVWDASTVMERSTMNHIYHEDSFYTHATVAARIEFMGDQGASLEILSLGGPSPLGKILQQTELYPDGQPPLFSIFQHRDILGSTVVTDTHDRQHLLDALARAIREGDERKHPVGWSIDAEYGITLTIGNKRAEYLINFRDGDCIASDPGLSEVPDYVSTYFGPQPIYRDGSVAFLNINPLREKAFIGILDKSAFRRTSTE